jgi:hypothetical protein
MFCSDGLNGRHNGSYAWVLLSLGQYKDYSNVPAFSYFQSHISVLQFSEFLKGSGVDTIKELRTRNTAKGKDAKGILSIYMREKR